MGVIKKIQAREVLDSRGNPTVEATVFSSKASASAIAPSGASTGIHEALELRDNGSRFHGKGVQKAIKNIKLIESKLKGMSLDQNSIDKTMIELDNTKNKSRLGANAILPVSLACARLAAIENNIPLYRYIQKLAKTNISLPTPYMNIINGGKHADNRLDFQEFMIVPKAKSFKERLRIGAEVYQELKTTIKKKYNTNVGDEGGFAPEISTPEQALNLLTTTVRNLGYEKNISFAIDAAASDFYKNNRYVLNDKQYSFNSLERLYNRLIGSYPIISLEDPFAEDNFNEFKDFTKQAKIQVVGDDLLVTNPERIKRAIKEKACNALLLKVNQIGTLSESIEAFKLAKSAGWNVMVSHRSGETEDTFIADLSVGLGTGQLKSGAPCRGERTAKYNRLLRIEEEVSL